MHHRRETLYVYAGGGSGVGFVGCDGDSCAGWVAVVFAKYDDPEIKTFWKANIEHSILLDKICGNASFSSSNGVVSSPRLPFNYQKRVNCLYTIESGRLNSFVLSIDSMRLGNDYERDGNCNRGWLIVSSQNYYIICSPCYRLI